MLLQRAVLELGSDMGGLPPQARANYFAVVSSHCAGSNKAAG